jgi:predicted ATPase/DNA-binding XRE family transcriptional regulator
LSRQWSVFNVLWDSQLFQDIYVPPMEDILVVSTNDGLVLLDGHELSPLSRTLLRRSCLRNLALSTHWLVHFSYKSKRFTRSHEVGPAMDDEPSFGVLLKHYRRAAHLTQQELATSAGYSSHYVSMLERGVRSPQPITIELLADALSLGTPERASLHGVAEPLPSAPLLRQTVPAAPSPLVGREQDLADILSLLQRDDVRLVTLTGPGGVGKTSLALHVMTSLRAACSDGAAFVDLAVVSDPDDVIPAVARALEVRRMAGQSIRERLIANLREREMLLLLDSFERVVEAAAELVDLLAGCPRIKLLVTSRAALRIRVEHEFRAQPLALPHAGYRQPARDLLQCPAVALFVQRATMVRPGFALDNENAAVAADICRRLDGLPLAIELAAARLSHLPLVALRDRLQHRLQMLTGGTRDLPTRQQRMRDTIAWSYDLLTPPAQALLRRLSVFAGSWSLAAAEALCVQVDAVEDVLDGLRTLVDGSLIVSMDNVPDEPRYRMLDTIQEYAGEELARTGELEEIRRRHSRYYVQLAEQAEPALQDRDQERWYQLLERDHDNLRAALDWLLGRGDTERALRLAGAVWRFWQRHGDIREGRRWLDHGLAQRERVPDEVRAKALWGASWLAYHEGDYARSRALSIEHLALARKWGDALSTRNALTGLGMVALAKGEYVEARLALQQALDACKPLGNIWHRATSYLNLGSATMLSGDLEGAAALFEEALALYRERGDEVFTARALQHLGYVALLQGDHARAQVLFETSLHALSDLGEKSGIADGLEAVAAIRAATGRVGEVPQLIEAANVLREDIGVPPFPFLRSVWEPYTAGAEELLGEGVWAAARARGRAASLQEVIAGIPNE